MIRNGLAILAGGRVRSITVHFTIIIAFFTGIGTGEAKIGVPSGSIIEVDKATVEAVLGIFEDADDAIKAHDLLVFGERAWRIRGNVGESPRVLPFGTAPHPLF